MMKSKVLSCILWCLLGPLGVFVAGAVQATIWHVMMDRCPSVATVIAAGLNKDDMDCTVFEERTRNEFYGNPFNDADGVEWTAHLSMLHDGQECLTHEKAIEQLQATTAVTDITIGAWNTWVTCGYRMRGEGLLYVESLMSK